jgi:hypothetical protein
MLVIRFCGKSYRLSKDGIYLPTGKQASFGISVMLYRYVIHCPEEAPLHGEWVTYREFSDAAPLQGYFTSNTSKIIEDRFAGNIVRLRNACKNLGGSLSGSDSGCDLAFEFDLLPRIPLSLRFYDKYDEFPARCTIMFRKSAEEYLDMESLAIGAAYLAGLIVKSPLKSGSLKNK